MPPPGEAVASPRRAPAVPCLRPGLALLLALSATCGCRQEQTPTSLRLHFPGSTIRLEMAPASAEHLFRAAGLIQDSLDDLKQNFDETDPNSQIARINRLAYSIELPIDPNTYQLLYYGRLIHSLSGGAYDFTTAPISYAWGFKGGPLPNEFPDNLIDTIRYSFGMDKVRLREFSVSLRYEANAIDIDHLLDGYLADISVRRVRDNVLGDFLITADGVSRCWGAKTASEPWHVALPEATNPSNRVGRVRLKSGQALAVTHAFSDFRMVGGKKRSHVIDPIRGKPVEDSLLAAVLAPTATEAQAFSVAALVKGVAGASELRQKSGRIELLVVSTKEPTLYYASPGFVSQLDPADAIRQSLRDFPPPPEPAKEAKDEPPPDAPPEPALVPGDAAPAADPAEKASP